jgi:hypothetical protein
MRPIDLTHPALVDEVENHPLIVEHIADLERGFTCRCHIMRFQFHYRFKPPTPVWPRSDWIVSDCLSIKTSSMMLPSFSTTLEM